MKVLGLEPRKLILLMLPISVAFIVGGYSGSLLGYKGFFWAGAIMWSTIIGIIDYNFTLIKRGLGFLGTTGRIVLILTSAVITSTVGDHIILEKTVARAKANHFTKLIKEAKVKAGEGLTADPFFINLQEVESTAFESLNETIANQKRECEKTVPGKKCNYITTISLPQAQSAYNKAEKSRMEYEHEYGSDDEIKELEAQSKEHDIILEMKLLYSEIFKEITTTIMFFLFAMMVICIETLPLLLKSGLTEGQVRNDEKTEREEKEEREKKNKSNIQKSPF